jgi:hypothetical protein
VETRLSDAEENSSTEVFEAFGMKVPTALSVYFALFTVLGIQAYLATQV